MKTKKRTKKRVLKRLVKLAEHLNPTGFDPAEVIRIGSTPLYIIGVKKDDNGDYIPYVDAHEADALFPLPYFASAAHAEMALADLEQNELEVLFGVSLSQRKKVPTPHDVWSIAEELMDIHGWTTTLDVKQQLRDAGFWAKQTEISALMKKVAKENDLDFNAADDNNNLCGHIVYSKN